MTPTTSDPEPLPECALCRCFYDALYALQKTSDRVLKLAGRKNSEALSKDQAARLREHIRIQCRELSLAAKERISKHPACYLCGALIGDGHDLEYLRDGQGCICIHCAKDVSTLWNREIEERIEPARLARVKEQLLNLP